MLISIGVTKSTLNYYLCKTSTDEKLRWPSHIIVKLQIFVQKNICKDNAIMKLYISNYKSSFLLYV